jgi:hypothetical protein
MMKRILLVFSLCFSPFVFSASSSYVCTVAGVYSHSSDGILADSGKSPYLDAKFNVDRAYGVILGDFGNSTYPIKQVLDPGGLDQSYKLIWMSSVVKGTGAGRNVGFLEVKEYSERRSKPFVLNDGIFIMAGTCE